MEVYELMSHDYFRDDIVCKFAELSTNASYICCSFQVTREASTSINDVIEHWFTFAPFEWSSTGWPLFLSLSNLLDLPDNEISTERRSVEVERVLVEVRPNED